MSISDVTVPNDLDRFGCPLQIIEVSKNSLDYLAKPMGCTISHLMEEKFSMGRQDFGVLMLDIDVNR